MPVAWGMSLCGLGRRAAGDGGPACIRGVSRGEVELSGVLECGLNSGLGWSI